MRKRQPIPPQHTDWLNTYLTRKGLTSYSDLDTDQHRTLRGAYRQMLLKAKLATGSPEECAKLKEGNTKLVAKKDEALQKNRDDESKIRRLEALMESQALELKRLKKLKTPVLGQGVYDGSIALAIAVKLLPEAPKGTTEQGQLRQRAILECGYRDIGERKLTKAQRVDVYSKIKSILNSY